MGENLRPLVLADFHQRADSVVLLVLLVFSFRFRVATIVRVSAAHHIIGPTHVTVSKLLASILIAMLDPSQ